MNIDIDILNIYILYQTLGCAYMLQSDDVQQISKKEEMLALHNECKCF